MIGIKNEAVLQTKDNTKKYSATISYNCYTFEWNHLKPLEDVQQKPQNMKHSNNKMELRPVQPNISLSSDDMMETVLGPDHLIRPPSKTPFKTPFKAPLSV